MMWIPETRHSCFGTILVGEKMNPKLLVIFWHNFSMISNVLSNGFIRERFISDLNAAQRTSDLHQQSELQSETHQIDTERHTTDRSDDKRS